MAELISISIDLKKIIESKIIQGKKGGKYYNLTVSVNDEADQYGNDVSVYDSQSKEQREAKEPRNYLGNGKVVWKSEAKPQDFTHAEKGNDDLSFLK